MIAVSSPLDHKYINANKQTLTKLKNFDSSFIQQLIYTGLKLLQSTGFITQFQNALIFH